jgi:hypothetical protein
VNPLNVKQLLTFIFDGEASTASANQTYEELLHAYVDAELDGEDAAAKFPLLKGYLDDCSPCREEYEEVKALLLMGRRGTFVKPPVEATFDFSYLLPPPEEPEENIWIIVDRAGKKVMELFTQVELVIKEGRAFFAELPTVLLPPAQVALQGSRMRRKEARIADSSLLLPSPEHDLSLRLLITTPPSGEEEISVTVQVNRLSSEEPVERAQVTLRDARYRLLESELTQEAGHVTFANMQSGSYIVEGKVRGAILQVPLLVT